MIVGQILLALAILPFGLALWNSITMQVVRASGARVINSRVAVLVPMRNEAANVAELVKSITAQSLCSQLGYAALDDHSTDQTLALLQKNQHASRLEIISGAVLPEGWLGKNFACHQLAASPTAANAEILVFIDADVRLEPHAISAAISLLEKLNWDFISPYPRQITGTLIEKIVQPLLQWSFMSSVPLRLSQRVGLTSMTVANGQFFVVRKSAYEKVGGHAGIKAEVLDDLELARALIRTGARGGVAEGSQIARCRMYENAPSLFAGYQKSLWRAFAHPLGALLANLFLFAVGVLPLIWIALDASHWELYLAAYLLVVASRVITAFKTRSNPFYSFLHCVAILIFNYLVITSWRGKARGQLMWRGRRI